MDVYMWHRVFLNKTAGSHTVLLSPFLSRLDIADDWKFFRDQCSNRVCVTPMPSTENDSDPG